MSPVNLLEDWVTHLTKPGLLWLLPVILAIALWNRFRSRERESPPPAIREKPGKYEFRLVIMSLGVNSHHTVRGDSLEFKHVIKTPIAQGESEVEYNVEPTTLYMWSPSLRRRIMWRIKRVQAGFLAIYRQGQPQAIGFHDPTVGPRLLKVIRTNRALTKALKDEFKEAMDVKRLFMIFLIIAVGLVLYLALTGQLKLGV